MRCDSFILKDEGTFHNVVINEEKVRRLKQRNNFVYMEKKLIEQKPDHGHPTCQGEIIITVVMIFANSMYTNEVHTNDLWITLIYVVVAPREASTRT